MNAKQFCMTHDPVASHDYYVMHTHGVETDGDYEYLYLSERVQPKLCGAFEWRFHRLKLYLSRDCGYYVNRTVKCYDGTKHRARLYINSFIRRGVWLPRITSEMVFENEV